MEGRYTGSARGNEDLLNDNNRLCTCGILQDDATFTLCPVHVYGHVPVENEIGISNNADIRNWMRDFALPRETISDRCRNYLLSSQPWWDLRGDADTQPPLAWVRDLFGRQNQFPRGSAWEILPFDRELRLYDLDPRAQLGLRLSDFW